MKKRTMTLFATAALSLAIIAACSNGEEQEAPIEDPEMTEEESVTPEEQEDEANEEGTDTSNEDASDSTEEETPSTTEDSELTGAILEEEGVLGGQVYVDGDMAIGTMMMDDTLTEEEINELAERYAEEIKAEYADKTVNVQAVQDGENVANVTID